MKKKFARILGVGLAIALLTSLMVVAMPVSADVGQAVVTFPTTDDAVISKTPANYGIRFKTNQALIGSSTSAFALPDPGDAITIIDAIGGDSGTITVTSGSVTVTGTGIIASSPIVPASGAVAWSTAAAQTIILTATAGADGTIGSWTSTASRSGINIVGGTAASSTSSEMVQDVTGVGVPGAVTLPDVGDAITITDTAAGDTVTMTLLIGGVTVVPSVGSTWTPVAGGGTLVLAASGSAVITATTRNVSFTTAGLPTSTSVISNEANELVTNGLPAASGDTITIVMPADTGVATGALVTGTLVNGPGWITSTWVNGNSGTPTFSGTTATRIIVLTLAANAAIGEGADIRVSLTGGITNPSASGSYTLTVETSKETTAVTSAAYAITIPPIGALPGIVSLYNPAGVLMNQKTGDHPIQDMINAATAGFIVEVGPGTYVENPDTLNADVTIEGAGSAEEVIVKGNWTIDSDDITIDNLTTQGTMTIIADDIVVQNCLISHASATAPVGVPAGMIDINTGADDVTVQNCTIDTTAGSVADVGIDVGGGDVLITGCTISIDAGTTTTADTAINVSAAAEVDATLNTITGASGVGYNTMIGVASTDTISENTFDGLQTAVKINGAADMTVSGNLMQNGTVHYLADATNAEAQVDVVNVAVAGSVSIQGNDIENNAGYSVTVRANADLVNVVGNYFSANTYGLQNKDTATGHILKAMLNYWGDSTGPTHLTNLAGTGDTVSDYVSFKPFATATVPEVSTATLAAAGTMDRSTTVGISFTTNNAGGAGDVTLARYSANPAISDPPYAALADGYYDVYAPGIVGGTQTILFYNANIKSDTVAYYYSTLSQSWSVCTKSAVAGNLAYVIVTVGAATSPGNADMGGTPFVLVTVPPSPTVTIKSPVLGAYDIPIDLMFTWDVVPSALRYELTLSEDPTFAIIEWSYNVETNFYKATDLLRYSTTYYWRVRALTGEPYQVGPSWVTPSGPWSTGIFTTIAEPVEAVEEGPGDITVETPTVTITPGEVNVDVAPAIPDYLLWVIVAIGAVLVTALIVLIVRTRRVA